MADPRTPWGRFLARPNDDRVKVFGVAFCVALVCAVVVSATSVSLKPLQDAHLEAERAARMAAMLDTLPGMRTLMEDVGVNALETRMINLASGEIADVDPATYDAIAAAEDPAQSIALSPDSDFAGLKRRANVMPVYLLERDGELLLIVLPVHGVGYQSTIRAFLALESDLNTIAALTIVEQGETPGLGAKIEDANWQALWSGKEIADENGEIQVTVVRGTANTSYEVDGISGATRTGNGISNMLRFWLGPDGFGPYLRHLKAEVS